MPRLRQANRPHDIANDAIGRDFIEDAVAIVRQLTDVRPEVMLTLGSGLADAAAAVDIDGILGFDQVPGLSPPRVEGHPGKLVVGQWGERPVIVFLGRLHAYEGHSRDRVTFPVRLARRLGAKSCLLTSMCGAISPKLRPGSLVILDNHLDFTGTNPLVGVTANDPSALPPETGEAYSKRLRTLLDESARILGTQVSHGVYVGVIGPNYETPAEIRALGMLGADVVGMSMVPEVLAARHVGMECAAIACVANFAAGVSTGPIRHADVLTAGNEISFSLAAMIERFLRMETSA